MFSLEFVYSGQNCVVFLGIFWSELCGFPGTSRHLNVGLFVCNIIHSFISLAAFYMHLVNYQVFHALSDTLYILWLQCVHHGQIFNYVIIAFTFITLHGFNRGHWTAKMAMKHHWCHYTVWCISPLYDSKSIDTYCPFSPSTFTQHKIPSVVSLLISTLMIVSIFSLYFICSSQIWIIILCLC